MTGPAEGSGPESCCRSMRECRRDVTWPGRTVHTAVWKKPAQAVPDPAPQCQAEEHGTGSQFLHDRVRAGDQLEAAAPWGTFTG